MATTERPTTSAIPPEPATSSTVPTVLPPSPPTAAPTTTLSLVPPTISSAADFVALMESMDTDENGYVDLGEVVEYYRVEKETKIAQIRQAADEAVAAVDTTYARLFECVTQGYKAVVKSSQITSAAELERVLQWANAECTIDTDVYTRQDVVQIVFNITRSQQYLSCTEAMLDKFPAGYKFSKKDVDSIAAAVQATCFATTTEPTPAPTRPSPTTTEILTYAKAVLEVLQNETEPVSPGQLHAFVKAHAGVMQMKITKVWYNSDRDRQLALEFVTKFYTRVEKCLDAAVVVDFIAADLNKNNVVDEFEIDQVVATARNHQLGQLQNKSYATSRAFLQAFFSIRETYDRTLECAHDGVTQIGNAVDRTLTREEFYGYEAWMARHCSNVAPDISLHGVPNDVPMNLTEAHVAMGQLQAKDLEVALQAGTGALHTQYIQDHYGLLRTCFDASFDPTGRTPYSTILNRTRFCLENAVPSTMPIQVIMSRADFHALLEKLFEPELTQLDIEIAKQEAIVETLRAKKAALEACIRRAVDVVATASPALRHADLEKAESYTNECVTATPPQ
ncbi:hypothetical protein DYB32_007422 [Aphanomyces invadans]|uniref:EF-hand domain-containing protein n=1 Tax=Aphanomyces invadans TaxID=157072 RepID=A0A418ANR0_9STRA|nr:hypothetical protein DYB32_007422 [Aphanomyces invadans]